MLKLLEERYIPSVVELGRNFFNASPYSSLTFSEEATENFLHLCLSRPEENICILSVEDDEAVGALVGSVSRLPFSDDLVAAEIAWWMEPAYRKGGQGLELKKAYEYWAEKMGAKKISMALLSGPYEKGLDRFYRNSGYHKAETAYVKDIN